MSETQAPFIVSNQLNLRPFTRACISAEYLEWLNDKELMMYSRQRLRTHSFDSCLEYLLEMDKAGNFFWSISSRIQPSVEIGTITASFNANRTEADLGILIGTSKIGAGYGKEAWGAVCHYLIQSERIKAVTGGASTRNVPMIKIFAYWNMKLVEVRESPGDNIYGGSISLYSVDAADWILDPCKSKLLLA